MRGMSSLSLELQVVWKLGLDTIFVSHVEVLNYSTVVETEKLKKTLENFKSSNRLKLVATS